MDSDLPRNPGNPYALSKALTEQMLEYFCKYRDMSCTAIRFPGLMRRAWMKHAAERFGRRGNVEPHANLDEGFTYLTVEDAAALMGAILRKPLPGFRTYMPAARSVRIPIPVPELIRRFYANVPQRKPMDQMKGLVDTTKIEQETGWSPQDAVPAT
jgi:nucleoside-diphosphate-sugar epimerase